MEILRLLNLHGPLSYSEIMGKVGLDPTKHAGRFAYHLRAVQHSNLISMNKETRKYRLTDIGVKVVNFAQELEEHALKKMGKLLVRSSRLAIEEFDRGRIVKALMREAQVPSDLAERIAREVEDRLLELQVKYLTAPLIREIVNAVLVEKGLEEYRHRLTRLGLPVFDVTETIANASRLGLGSEAVRRMAGDAVLKEYTLLNVLPRNIADAHLSGVIHVSNAGAWVLKPDYIQHDLRFFLRGAPNFPTGLDSPPKSFQAALTYIVKAFEAAQPEVNTEQSMDMFNVFLAPYAYRVSDEDIEDALQGFLLRLTQLTDNPLEPVNLSLGIEFEVPKALEGVEAVEPGKKQGLYSQYEDEALRITSSLLKLYLQMSAVKPILNPSLIFKARSPSLREKSKGLNQAVYELAAKDSTPYFANPSEASFNEAYASDGMRFTSTEGEAWEAGTLRASCIGDVTVNLPRIAYESAGRDTVFNEGLEASLNLAMDALEVRYRALYDRIRGNLLPFLFQGDGDPYSRFESTMMSVSFVGLNEATITNTGRSIYESKDAQAFAEKVVKGMTSIVDARCRQSGERFRLSQVSNEEASERLVRLDLEKYGQVVMKTQLTRSAPYYTNSAIIPLEADVPLSKRLELEGVFQQFIQGGGTTLIHLKGSGMGVEPLLRLSENIRSRYHVGFYTYSRYLTHCRRCGKTYTERYGKCPSCGSASAVTQYGRPTARYTPLRYWPQAKLSNMARRVAYSLESLSNPSM